MLNLSGENGSMVTSFYCVRWFGRKIHIWTSFVNGLQQDRSTASDCSILGFTYLCCFILLFSTHGTCPSDCFPCCITFGPPKGLLWWIIYTRTQKHNGKYFLRNWFLVSIFCVCTFFLQLISVYCYGKWSWPRGPRGTVACKQYRVNSDGSD